ncbi:helix-turn-helix domain-containing protein [Methylacidiphilum fumariolicum]|uniref:helix-turn-helix domain-containing protein n=1 Tax=Candidatus Methylacidiphilum fumarolicum TaxID=591154 RepID=UPI0009A17A54|nr:helix-turn-helix domain-containing protein [Candidatus Methylacidiphilum fumarolicum]MBW6415989.1 helix-turn-helix domain-containing protein [Candidatus Methylacidiphilum fumarolicum]
MMIASPAGLPVLGPVERKVTYRLYPSKTVRDELLRTRWVHCFLWNLALEERRRAWKEEKRRIGFAEQCDGSPSSVPAARFSPRSTLNPPR